MALLDTIPKNKYTVENEVQKKTDITKERISNEQLRNQEDFKIDKLLKILISNGFNVKGGSLVKTMDNGKQRTIGNFIPFIKKKIIYDNGILLDNQIRYKLKGFLIANWAELPEIEISKEDYNSFKFIIGSEWDKFAIVEAGNQIYFRQVAQILSNETMEEETIFNHTGFRKIGNKLIYLYENGAIGDIDNIRAELSNDNLQQYNFTNTTFDVTEALNKSLSILDVAKRNIAIPLLATTYISPLTSILQEEGIYADFILYFIGKSGSGKSSFVAAAGLSHFGNNFKRNNFPCSFRDSLNNLEKKAFILKDNLNVIDDLNPEGTGNLKIEKYEKITRNVWR